MGEIIPFPVLKIDFEPLGTNEKYFVKKSILIRGLKVGEMIQFPVWIIPFPVLNSLRYLFKRVFLIRGLEVGEI